MWLADWLEWTVWLTGIYLIDWLTDLLKGFEVVMGMGEEGEEGNITISSFFPPFPPLTSPSFPLSPSLTFSHLTSLSPPSPTPPLSPPLPSLLPSPLSLPFLPLFSFLLFLFLNLLLLFPSLFNIYIRMSLPLSPKLMHLSTQNIPRPATDNSNLSFRSLGIKKKKKSK